MFLEIKNRIESQILGYMRQIDKTFSLRKISPLLYRSIDDFILRKGKRIRPALFIIGYLSFAKKAAPNLYKSAVSLELLHDFMLVHDDIIDKSDLRRGKPSMHLMLERSLKKKKDIKFNGQDLAIVAGDTLYALALHSFLSVKEDSLRKEMALKKLIETAVYTASGEFIELLSGIEGIDKISKKRIYRIYDLKTANYTFASPLAIGAILAGAKKEQLNKIFKYGMCLGRAFQIKDDILGLFSKESETGKSNLADLQEAKKTILIWHAYRHTDTKNQKIIQKILKKNEVTGGDLKRIRQIVISSATLNYARKEISGLLKKAGLVLRTLTIPAYYKNCLQKLSVQILDL